MGLPTISLKTAQSAADREQAELAGHEAERARADYEAALEAHFKDASKSELIEIWKTGRNLEGSELTAFEFQALCEQWIIQFQALPEEDCGYADSDPGNGSVASQTDEVVQPIPTGDEAVILGPTDAAKYLGVSTSTVNRMADDGRLPLKRRVEGKERKVGWTIAELKAAEAKGFCRERPTKARY